MTLSEVVKKFWRDFEVIAFKAVKNNLPTEKIITETLTQAAKDGGYDGEFILTSQNDALLRVIFEAKLRSDISGDLPLQSFAKALIVAVVRNANMIYIVTNLHFSQRTIEVLENYSVTVPLDIKLINGYSVKKFIEEHDKQLSNISIELKNFLLNENCVSAPQCLSLRHTFDITLTKNSNSIYTSFEKFFKQNGAILLVRGSIGSGKSYYIEGLCNYLMSNGKRTLSIDVSKCLTYRELFLEIVEKTTGISLELTALMDEKNFQEAFASIGNEDTSMEDICMLRYAFARDTNYPYDYTVLFSQLVKFFFKVYHPISNKSDTVIAFYNIVYGQKEVIQLLLSFLKSEQRFSCVLEIANDIFWEQDFNEWTSIKQVLSRLSPQTTYTIPEQDIIEAEFFLKQHVCGLTDVQIRELICKYGKSPAELSLLIELIDYADIYKNTPKELIYREIMNLDNRNNSQLYDRCLEYLQLTNSNILYVYAFLYFLGGSIECAHLLNFFYDKHNINFSFNTVLNSNLFVKNGRRIETRNAFVNKQLQIYCENHLSFAVAKIVYDYISNRIENFNISIEQRMELKVRFYSCSYENCNTDYLISLCELGEHYLKMGLIEKAKEKFKRAIIAESKNDSYDLLLKVKIYLGRIESLIWNTGDAQNEIEILFSALSKLINSLYDIKTKQAQLLVLQYFKLNYQFNHFQDKHELAYTFASNGKEWILQNKLYVISPVECGQMWRFYAVAEKEKEQNIYKCIKAFEESPDDCKQTAQFQFGYIIHKNMIVSDPIWQNRVKIKLENYKKLEPFSKYLSIDERLHYQVNVAALHFMNKDYNLAQTLYEKLLQESEVFSVVREEVRILNDMANICWINGDVDEARKKYYMAKQRSSKSGVVRNYWPVLVNIISFEINCGVIKNAYELLDELRPHIEYIYNTLQNNGIGFEQLEYCEAALTIHLKNLWSFYEKYHTDWVYKDIETLMNCPIFKRKCNEGDIKNSVKQLNLRGSLFEHNGIYVLKN